MVTLAISEAARAEIPPLEGGDNLSPDEFERISGLHPEIKHAELIDGLVYVELVVGPAHGSGHAIVAGWLMAFWAGRPELQVCDNTTVRFADGSRLQPDLLLRRTESAGGRSTSTLSAIEGPPELAVEVAASSASFDLFQKKAAYERNGVREYVVWQLYDERVDWFVLRSGHYEPLIPGTDGVFESVEFPGLRLSVPHLLAGDFSGVLATLNR
jgi:Uma2 family endonuclease